METLREFIRQAAIPLCAIIAIVGIINGALLNFGIAIGLLILLIMILIGIRIFNKIDKKRNKVK